MANRKNVHKLENVGRNDLVIFVYLVLVSMPYD